MLELAVLEVRHDQVEPLRQWFDELSTTRRAEALATLVDETVDHETATLVEVAGRFLLVYAMEVRDPEQSRRSARSGSHPIDAEHHAVLARAIAGPANQELLLDLRP